MGVEILEISTKYYNEFKNGVGFTDSLLDFTNNFTGSVMENVKLVKQIDISWDSQSSESDRFNVDAINLRISRTGSGNFINDGFNVGDVFDLYDETPAIDFTGEITSISNTIIIFTVISGTPTGTINGYSEAVIRGLTDLSSLIYGFGLIGNSETFNIESKVSGNDQAYYGSGIGIDSGGGRSTTFVDLQKLGSYKDWQTGSLRCRYVSNPSTYVQRFEIEHEFTIVPYYLDGEISNLQNNVLPNLYTGLNTLKYAYNP